MVSIVLVSHSARLAEAAAELAGLMAKKVRIIGAGGMEDGDFGTSFNRIYDAIEQVYSPDGVMVLMDMGSSVMTTEMVLEEMEDMKVCMADAPFVEGRSRQPLKLLLDLLWRKWYRQQKTHVEKLSCSCQENPAEFLKTELCRAFFVCSFFCAGNLWFWYRKAVILLT